MQDYPLTNSESSRSNTYGIAMIARNFFQHLSQRLVQGPGYHRGARHEYYESSRRFGRNFRRESAIDAQHFWSGKAMKEQNRYGW